MKGGKEGRRQGKEEKSYNYSGMDEDRTIMPYVHSTVYMYTCTLFTSYIHNHKPLTWSHLSMHFWWKS